MGKMGMSSRRQGSSQVHPSLSSKQCSNPSPTLLTILSSSSFSHVSGTHSSSSSVISDGKVNVGKRVAKWYLVERELCWPPESDSLNFYLISFLTSHMVCLIFKNRTSMTVALAPYPLSPSPVFSLTVHPHSSPQVSPVLFNELTKNLSGTGIPFLYSLSKASPTWVASRIPDRARLASWGVCTFLACRVSVSGLLMYVLAHSGENSSRGVLER